MFYKLTDGILGVLLVNKSDIQLLAKTIKYDNFTQASNIHMHEKAKYEINLTDNYFNFSTVSPNGCISRYIKDTKGYKFIQFDILEGITDYVKLSNYNAYEHVVCCTYIPELDTSLNYANTLYIGTSKGILIKFDYAKFTKQYAVQLDDKEITKIDSVFIENLILIIGFNKTDYDKDNDEENIEIL